MSTSSTIEQLYQRFAPRWVKVIRWREWSKRVVAHQKYLVMVLYVPGFACYVLEQDRITYNILLKGVNTQEGVQTERQNCVARNNSFLRDWDYGEFEINDMAPYYDLSRRRLKYPQYYEGRYKDVKKTVWGEVLEVKPRVAKPDSH